MAEPTKDTILREMERRSLDTIMVYNPTDSDYRLEWDKRYHVIPKKDRDLGYGKGRMELPRYLAEKYAREMKNMLINDMERKAVEKLVAEYEAKGQRFRDKYEENSAALPLVPKTSDEKLIAQIYDMVILGLVREFGNDFSDEAAGHPIDDKTAEERVLDRLNRPFIDDSPVVPPVTPEEAMPKKNSKVLEGVAK